MTYNKILKNLNSKTITIDNALEELAKLGYCPNVLNDDNGHWAVTFDGYQNVPTDENPCDIETHFSVDAEYWKNNIYDALIYALNK